MLIWTGWGILVPVLWMLGAVLTGKLFSDHVAFLGGAFFTAVITLAWGLKLRRTPGRLLVDPQTGQQVELKRRDAFMFIPVLYWAPIAVVLGLVLHFSHTRP